MSIKRASIVLCLVGCANGGEGPLGPTGSQGEGGDGNTSSLGGTGGESTTPIGDGGMGQGPTTSTGTSTVTSGPTTTTTNTTTGMGGEGGGPPEVLDNVFMIAGGGSATVTSRYDVIMNTGFSWPWQVMTQDPIALSRAPNGTSHAFLRQTPDGLFMHAHWTGTNWMLLSEVQAGTTIVGGPASTANGSEVHAAVHLTNGSYGYSRVDGTTFGPALEAIGSPPSAGVSAPAIAVSGGAAVVAFVGDDGDLYDRARSGGSWGSAHTHGLTGLATIAPALAAPPSGPELIAVVVRASDNAILVTMREAGSWSSAVEIPTAFTTAPPSLTVLDDGAVKLTWVSADFNGWMAEFNGSDFDAPFVLVPNVQCPPAITSGADGAEMELVFTDLQGIGYWARFINGQWLSPTFVTTAASPSCLAITASP